MLNRSRSTNNSSPSATPSWRSSRNYGYHEPNHAYDSNYGHLFLPTGSRSSQSIQDFRGSIEEPPRSFARRTTSFGSASFPTHNQHPPMQIVIFDPQAPRESNHWPGRALPVVRAAGDRHHPRPRSNTAVESLRKEVYHPSTKRITNAVNLYYRDTPVDPRALANEDDGKRCSVCLEDFERGQEVAVTPCKHMFHDECIVPWAKSNPHCPVCRSALCPKAREPSSAPASTISPTRFDVNSYYNDDGRTSASTAGPGLSTQEFLSILRALGDGFQLE